MRLGDVSDIIAGQHITADLYDSEGTGTPYLTGPADFGEMTPTVSKWTHSPKSFAADTDVLLTVKGAGVGKANLGVNAAIGRQLMAIRPRTGTLDQLYLYFFLRSRQVHVAGLAQGATVPGIAIPDVAALRIPVPALAEQRRIAALLDKAGAIRRKRQQAIRLVDDLLRSAFLDMFGDPVTNPKGWPVERLDQIAAVNRGKFTPRPRNDPRFYGGPFPFIQTGDLSCCTGLLRTWQQTLNGAGTQVSRHFPRGTIAIAIAANIGDTAILDFDCYFPDSVVGIQAYGDRATAEYIEGCLRFFQRPLQEGAPETAQKNINLEVLRPLRVPLPPLGSQRRFSALFWKHSSTTDGMAAARGQAEDFFRVLVQRAFQGVGA